jgi:hypothetical protein
MFGLDGSVLVTPDIMFLEKKTGAMREAYSDAGGSVSPDVVVLQPLFLSAHHQRPELAVHVKSMSYAPAQKLVARQAGARRRPKHGETYTRIFSTSVSGASSATRLPPTPGDFFRRDLDGGCAA